MAKKNGRIYWRERGGEARAYGDFRDYADVGGGREALKAEGATSATTDEEVAEKLVADRLEELREARRRKELTGVRRVEGLESFASWHLVKKAEAGCSSKYLAAVEKHMERAVEFFGADRDLGTVRPSDVRRWIERLRETSNGRGGTLSEKTVRDHLDSLSNLYRRAISEEVVPTGHNPAMALMDKPTPERKEADWLDPHEAALLLEAARTYEPPENKGPVPDHYPIIATMLLTGGRRSEVLGLKASDVSFDRGLVFFRGNEHRSLKSRHSDRYVPLWPQLREILQQHVFGGSAPPSGLLFPSPRTGKMIRDMRRSLDAIGERAGFEEGRIRCHLFRHTYTALRVQCVEPIGTRETEDGGQEPTYAPISLFTVARELGHGSTSLIEDRYGHLARHPNDQFRRPVVKYRAEEFEEKIGRQVRELQVA